MGPHTWRQPPRSLWPRQAAESRSGSGSSSRRTHGGLASRANARERSPRSMMPHALFARRGDCHRRGTLAAALDGLRRRSGRPSGVYPHTRRKRLARGAGWRLSGRRLRRPPVDARLGGGRSHCGGVGRGGPRPTSAAARLLRSAWLGLGLAWLRLAWHVHAHACSRKLRVSSKELVVRAGLYYLPLLVGGRQ